MNKHLKKISKIARDIQEIIINATDPDIVGTQALHHEVEFIIYKLTEIRGLCSSDDNE